MAAIGHSFSIGGLAACVTVLGFMNYKLSTYEVDTTTPVAGSQFALAGTGRATKDLPLALTLDVRGIGEFPETAARPIFFPGRRVPEKPKASAAVEDVRPVVAAGVTPMPDPLRLLGLMGKGTGRSALVRTAQELQGVWIAVGDEYRGWQVREITGDGVIVEAQGERQELRLYASTAKPASR
ncbi:MAG: hypothetical protein ABL901_16535 [Hyphomicrobiaceae bacterium]